MDWLPDGLRSGCGNDHPAPHLPETKYYGGAPAPFLSDTGKRKEGTPPVGVANLLHGATALLRADHCSLPGNGMVDLNNPGDSIDVDLFIQV